MRNRKRRNGRSSGKKAPDSEQTDGPGDLRAALYRRLILGANWFHETEWR
jgi:hypothetical protein